MLKPAKQLITAIFLFILLLLTASDINASEKLTVFAAASTTAPVQEISKAFTTETGIKIRLNFSSSGTLAKQLEKGAVADYYISASKKWGKYATEKDLLQPETVGNILTNTLVLIKPKGTALKETISFSKDFNIATAFSGRLSIGNPKHVPAGRYAKDSLEYLGWWQELQKRLIFSKDVKSVLRVVEVGEAELGCVYGSDASSSSKVDIVGVFPADSHKQIVYVSGICTGAKPLAAKFAAFIRSPAAAAIFSKYGFVPYK